MTDPYRHLLILNPDHASPKQWKDVTQGIEALQAAGYHMIDYHELRGFVVLVFQLGVSPVAPMPKITDYGPPVGPGYR